MHNHRFMRQEYHIGDRIRIDDLKDIRSGDYNGRTGTIEHIDSIGQLHGTWGGLALIPGIDGITVIKNS